MQSIFWKNVFDFVGNIYGFIFFFSVLVFIFGKKIAFLLDTADIESRHFGKEEEQSIKQKKRILCGITFLIFVSYFFHIFFSFDFLGGLIKSLFVILCIVIVNLLFKRRILKYYGKEIEIGGESYFKKDYEANMFFLLTNLLSFFFWVFLFLKIMGFDSMLEMGGVWAWILAFMWFTAPVWALDMVAWIIILHNGSLEAWNVIHIPETNTYAWVKSISLTEVKLIDIRYNYPIILRPSRFRELFVENLSHGLAGKTNKIHRTIEIKVAYENSLEEVSAVCFEAFDDMIQNLPSKGERKYFWDEPSRFLDIESFWDHATHYKFSYMISSPFYIVKAERILNVYLQKYQKKYGIYFSTPYLVSLEGEKI